MQRDSYHYLFPYEKVPRQSRLLIYGAGDLGRDYLRQMLLTGYCQVVGMVDKNYTQYTMFRVPVFAPDAIHMLSFDFVVVALRTETSYQEIKQILHREGVREEQIVCIFERQYTDVPITYEALEAIPGLACQKRKDAIAILLTGGIGDMVIQKRLLMELVSLAPECQIDLFNIKSVDFLKVLYENCENIHAVIPDLGYRYDSVHDQYACAFQIEACHFIRMDTLFPERFPLNENALLLRLLKLREETRKEQVGRLTPAHVTLYRRYYQGLNAYTGFSYCGTFEFQDHHVEIPFSAEAETAFRALKLGRYITVNQGNGDCRDGSKVAKSWPSEYFEELVAKIRQSFPKISLVQLGDSQANLIYGVDYPIFGEDFRLVFHILKHSLLHIDIEGGLVHVATQLGTKCVVLFGPTMLEYYGYEENINLRAGNCHNCWGLYSDVNRCAAQMEKPACMYSLTPSMVWEKVEEYLQTLEGLTDG